MAEVEKKEVTKTKVTVKHGGARGMRFMYDASGKQHLIGPGQEVEMELPEPEAKRLQEMAKNGHGDLIIGGTDPADVEHADIQDPVETPKEHETRGQIAEKEFELMQAG